MANHPNRKKPPSVPVCGWCLSDEVQRDAWAVYNVRTRSWQLGSVFDAANCECCEGETSLETIPLALFRRRWEARGSAIWTVGRTPALVCDMAQDHRAHEQGPIVAAQLAVDQHNEAIEEGLS